MGKKTEKLRKLIDKKIDQLCVMQNAKREYFDSAEILFAGNYIVLSIDNGILSISKLQDYSVNFSELEAQLDLELFRALQKHFEMTNQNFLYLTNYESILETSLSDEFTISSKLTLPSLNSESETIDYNVDDYDSNPFEDWVVGDDKSKVSIRLLKRSPRKLADYGKLELFAHDFENPSTPKLFATISFGYAKWDNTLPDETQDILRKLHFEFWRIF